METRFKGFSSMKQDVNLKGDRFEEVDTWMEIFIMRKELRGAIDQRGDRWEGSRKIPFSGSLRRGRPFH